MAENLSVEKLRSFVASLDEGERREILQHWTRAAETQTKKVLRSVAEQLQAQILGGSVPGAREVLDTAVSAWNDGAVSALDELLGIGPMNPTDIGPEVDLILRRLEEPNST
jgi:MoxR-like ATPase